MGYSNKLATKVRTRAQISPVGFSGPWSVDHELTFASIMGSAAAILGQMQLTSSAYRGRDFLGIRTDRNTSRSLVWLERARSRKWILSLGVERVNYARVFDWQLGFEIVDIPGGYEVHVQTPSVAMYDGRQVHKHQYVEIRDLILTGLRLGQSPNRAREEAVSEQGLRVPPPPRVDLRDDATQRVRVYRTQLSSEVLRTRLDLLPFRCVRHDARTQDVKVGVGTGLDERFARIEVLGHDEVQCVRISYDLGSTGHALIDCVSALHAASLCEAVFETIRAFDPQAEAIIAEAGVSGE